MENLQNKPNTGKISFRLFLDKYVDGEAKDEQIRIDDPDGY